MSSSFELDDSRLSVLERVARRRKLSLRRVLERAVDEFIERAEDEQLLASSTRVARRTGLRERDAVRVVRKWRKRRDAGRG